MSGVAERSLHTRAARSVEALRNSFTDNLFQLTGRSFQKAAPRRSGLFSHGDRQLFAPLTSKLSGQDSCLVCADYRAHVDCQDTVVTRYRDTAQRARMSNLNVARIGRLSSGRAIREYSEESWRVQPVPVKGCPAQCGVHPAAPR